MVGAVLLLCAILIPVGLRKYIFAPGLIATTSFTLKQALAHSKEAASGMILRTILLTAFVWLPSLFVWANFVTGPTYQWMKSPYYYLVLLLIIAISPFLAAVFLACGYVAFYQRNRYGSS